MDEGGERCVSCDVLVEEAGQQAYVCQSCQPPPPPGGGKEQVLCHMCLVPHARKSHNIVSREGRHVPGICRLHFAVNMLFCLECSTPFCHYCLQHARHAFTPVAAQVESVRARVDKLLEMARSVHKPLVSRNTTLQQFALRQQHKVAAFTRTLHYSTFEPVLRAAFDAVKFALLNDVTAWEHSVNQHLEEAVALLDGNVAVCNSLHEILDNAPEMMIEKFNEKFHSLADQLDIQNAKTLKKYVCTESELMQLSGEEMQKLLVESFTKAFSQLTAPTVTQELATMSERLILTYNSPDSTTSSLTDHQSNPTGVDATAACIADGAHLNPDAGQGAIFRDSELGRDAGMRGTARGEQVSDAHASIADSCVPDRPHLRSFVPISTDADDGCFREVAAAVQSHETHVTPAEEPTHTFTDFRSLAESASPNFIRFSPILTRNGPPLGVAIGADSPVEPNNNLVLFGRCPSTAEAAETCCTDIMNAAESATCVLSAPAKQQEAAVDDGARIEAGATGAGPGTVLFSTSETVCEGEWGGLGDGEVSSSVQDGVAHNSDDDVDVCLEQSEHGAELSAGGCGRVSETPLDGSSIQWSLLRTAADRQTHAFKQHWKRQQRLLQYRETRIMRRCLQSPGNGAEEAGSSSDTSPIMAANIETIRHLRTLSPFQNLFASSSKSPRTTEYSKPKHPKPGPKCSRTEVADQCLASSRIRTKYSGMEWEHLMSTVQSNCRVQLRRIPIDEHVTLQASSSDDDAYVDSMSDSDDADSQIAKCRRGVGRPKRGRRRKAALQQIRRQRRNSAAVAGSAVSSPASSRVTRSSKLKSPRPRDRSQLLIRTGVGGGADTVTSEDEPLQTLVSSAPPIGGGHAYKQQHSTEEVNVPPHV